MDQLCAMCNNTLTYVNGTKDFVKQAESLAPAMKEEIPKVGETKGGQFEKLNEFDGIKVILNIFISFLLLIIPPSEIYLVL